MAHKHKDLIIAWANGATIECETPATHADSIWLGRGYTTDVVWKWDQIKSPSWDVNKKYRVKPEPKADVHTYVHLQVQPLTEIILKLTLDGETGAFKSVEKINV